MVHKPVTDRAPGTIFRSLFQEILEIDACSMTPDSASKLLFHVWRYVVLDVDEQSLAKAQLKLAQAVNFCLELY